MHTMSDIGFQKFISEALDSVQPLTTFSDARQVFVIYYLTVYNCKKILLLKWTFYTFFDHYSRKPAVNTVADGS